MVGDIGLTQLGKPDKVEQHGNNVHKLYAKSRVDAIVQQQADEYEQQQIQKAAELDRIRRFGSTWEKLEAGLIVDLDLHFSGGWRLTFNGDLWHGYYQLFFNDEILMADNDDFDEAIEIFFANAAAWLQRDLVFPYAPTSHLIAYDYQIGDWELVVAVARECEPRPAPEVDRLRHFSQRYAIPEFEILHECTELGYCDWHIRHRDGFRITGIQDDDNINTAKTRALLEIAAYENPTP